LIVEGFADALLRTLRVDFVYARVASPSQPGVMLEAITTEEPTHPRLVARDIGLHLAPWLSTTLASPIRQVPSPIGDGRQVGLAVAAIGHAGGVLGTVAAGSSREDFGSDYDRLLIRIGANLLAVALQGAQLQAAQAALATLEERQRMARELHDSVSQALYAIVLDISTAQQSGTEDEARLQAILANARAAAEMGLAEMRSAIFALRPETLEKEGLVSALEKGVAVVRARYALPVEASLGQEPDIPLETKEVVYRVALEAVQNSAKHAGAKSLTIALNTRPGELALEVVDDGKGFDPHATFPGHLGLRSMQERVTSVGGAFDIRSGPQGTAVCVRIPLEAVGKGSGDSRAPR
jgi:signal transduction histidine kinase